MHAILAESVDEAQHVRSIVGGYAVRHTRQTVELFGDKLEHARITDWMDVVGVRENVVMLNKIVEKEGRYSEVRCSSHRFVYSDRYPNQLRIAVMFEEPYLQIGASTTVEIRYVIEDAFKGEEKRWTYDISVDCNELTFQLVAPAAYAGIVQVVKALKPLDYVLQSIVASAVEGRNVFTGNVKTLDLGSTYAIKWT